MTEEFSYKTTEQKESEIERRILQLAGEATRLDELAKAAERTASEARQRSIAAWQVVRNELRQAADQGFHLPSYFDHWR
jgi:hypothetical protein